MKKLTEHPLLKKTLEKLSSKGSVVETLLAYLVRGLGAVSLLGLYAVIAKRLTEAEAGYVLLGLAVSTVLSQLSPVGLQTLSLRQIAARSLEKDSGEIAYLARKTRWLAMPWAFALSVLVFCLAEWLAVTVFRKPPLGPVLQWIAPSIFLSGVAFVYSSQLQGLRMFTESLVTLALGTQLAAMVLIFVFDCRTPVSMAQAYSVGSAINLVLAIWFWQRRVSVPLDVMRASKVEMPDVVSSCFSFWIVKAMILAVNWAGILIVGILVEDAAESALFGVAQRVANLVNFLLIGVNVVVTPRFARFWREQKLDKIRDVALKSTAAISLAALPIVCVLVFFPRTFLALFKPGYVDAAPLLVILVLSQFFNVLTGSVNQLLSMCEMEHDLRNIVVLSGLASILLTAVFTALWGVTGAALAAAISLLIQNLAAVFVVRKKLGFSMFRALHVNYLWSLAGLKR